LLLPFAEDVTFGILATITPEVVPFRAYVPFQAFCRFFKYIMEVVFYEDIQHRL
jgi:hypothetical protein